MEKKTKAAEAVKTDAQNVAENTETKTETAIETAAPEAQKLDEVVVPENAEEITQEEALAAAADEVNKLRAENTEIKQKLDEVIKNANDAAEAAGKQIQELEQKLAAVEGVVKEKEEQLKAAAQTSGSNAFYADLLDKLKARFDEYSGIRRERLRKEFITDITEEIQRQKELLTNA